MRKKEPELLANCLKTFKKSWSEIDNFLELTQNWEEIVGRDLSKECKPLKIEKKILTIGANHPQWRQALIYNKHKLKDSISRFGIQLVNIRVVQYYQSNLSNQELSKAKDDWKNHPSKINNDGLSKCKICERPTPNGEIARWGKCAFCWRIE